MADRVVSLKTARIKIWQQSSSLTWLEQAIANLNIILSDRFHYERKAAVAIDLIFRYPSHHKLVRQLTAIASWASKK